MKHLFWIAGIPALLGSTAAIAADDAHPFFALSGSGGVSVINLPAQTGVFSNVAGYDSNTGNLAIGPTLGFNAVVGLGKVGDWDAFVGATGFGTYAMGSSSSTMTFSGIGTVSIPGLTTPSSGSISLTTARASGPGSASYSSNATGVAGNANIPVAVNNTPGTGQTGSAVTEGGGGFVWAAGNTVVTAGGVGSSLAAGAVVDPTGSMFLAVGDLDGLAITTTVKQSVIYAGLDLTGGASGSYDDATQIQAYAGPSYRYLSQSNSTGLTVDLPEAPSQPAVHPLYTLDRDFSSTTNYLGGVVGMGISRKISDDIVFSLGAEGSLYYASTSGDGSDSVTISGGGPSPVTTMTVDQGGVSDSGSGVAYALRGQTALTKALTPTMDVTLAGTFDYLSRAPMSTSSAAVTYTPGAGTADASWTSGGAATPLLSFGSMWAFSGTVSLTGHF